MSTTYKSGFCKNCNTQRMVARRSPNHILHLLLTLLTGGFWIVIWILCLPIGGWRCVGCGSRKIRHVH